MKKTLYPRLLIISLWTLLFVLFTSMSANAQPGGGDWKVWVKTTPCSGRFDWISVAKTNPTGGGNFFYLANTIFPGTACTHEGCTFSEATAIAATLRLSPQFANYCCHDYSVWRNDVTGNMTIVVGKFGTAGPGWKWVKGELCCEEAEALAGIPGACSGNTKKTQPPGIKCWPGSHPKYDPQTKKTECYCDEGLVWNSTKTACVDPQQLVNATDCSVYPGSYAAWNAQAQRVECYCPAGKKWNASKTACIDDVVTTSTNCWPGSHAAWDPATQRTLCYCDAGLVWNSTKTACVDPQDLVKGTNCSAYPGSYAAWNTQTQRVECWCPAGKVWNSTKTACIDDPSKVNCWPGSHAEYNSQTQRTECFCDPGLVWNSTKTACVKAGNVNNGNNNGNNNGGQHCSADDQARFARMVGSWKAYRVQVTIGGSCDNVTGTWKETEWCEGIDETYNASVARINGTITGGRMSGGTLQVEYQSPPSPHNSKGTKGTGSCYLQSDGTLTCSFTCEGDMKKQ